MRLISTDPEVQARYEKMIVNGQSESMAEMLATRSVPGCRTDSTFLAGRHDGHFRSAQERDYLATELRNKGGSPEGKIYLSSLARYTGDPEAWVSGRGDVERVCNQRGWSCEGSVNVKGRRDCSAPDPYEPPAEVVADEMEQAVAMDPGLAEKPKKLKQKRREIREKLAGHRAKELVDD